MMHVLVTGSSRISSSEEAWVGELLRERFGKFDGGNATLFNGGAWGVDKAAVRVAETQRFFEIRTFPAQWSRYGKGAGIIRNGYMLDAVKNAGRHDDEAIVLAVLPKGIWTNGTLDMSKRVISSGFRLEIWVPRSCDTRQIYAELPVSIDVANAMTLTY